MAYELPSDVVNLTSGYDSLFVYISSQVPIFIPMMLFTIWVIITMGGYFSQERRTNGFGDLFSWVVIGGFITSIVSLIMTLSDGIINLYTLIAVISIEMVLVVILFITKVRE